MIADLNPDQAVAQGDIWSRAEPQTPTQGEIADET